MNSENQTELFLRIWMPLALFVGPILILFMTGLIFMDAFIFKTNLDGWIFFVTLILIFLLMYFVLFLYCKNRLGYFSQEKIKKHISIFIIVPLLAGSFWLKDLYRHKKVLFEQMYPQVNKK